MKGTTSHYFILEQWRIHRVSDAGIPIWALKLCAQTAEKLIKKHQVFNEIFKAVVSTYSKKFNKKETQKRVETRSILFAYVYCHTPQ